MKKVLYFTFLLAIITSTKIAYANTNSFTIDNLTIYANIQKNGDVKVDEYFTYNYNEDFNGITRDLNIIGCDGYSIDQVAIIKPNTNIKLYAHLDTTTNNLIYNVESNSDTEKIILYYPCSNESIIYNFQYTIKSAAKKYSDVGEFYWNFFNVYEDCPNIKSGSLSISLDDDCKFDENNFTYTILGKGVFKSYYSSKFIRVNFKDLSSSIGVKLDFQKEYLSLIHEEPITSKEAFLLDSDNYTFLSTSVLLILSLIIGIIVIIISRKKQIKTINKYRSNYNFINTDIYSSIPEEVSPALLNLLFNEHLSCNNSLPLTLIYLSSLGYYELCTTLDSHNNASTDIIFIRNCTDTFPKENHLRFLLIWFSEYEHHGSFSLLDIRNLLENTSNADAYVEKYNKWCELVVEDAENLFFYNKSLGENILTNKYHNEYLKWIAYKNYLLSLNSIVTMPTRFEATLMILYALTLDISESRIHILINYLLSLDSKIINPLYASTLSYSLYLFNNIDFTVKITSKKKLTLNKQK